LSTSESERKRTWPRCTRNGSSPSSNSVAFWAEVASCDEARAGEFPRVGDPPGGGPRDRCEPADVDGPHVRGKRKLTAVRAGGGTPVHSARRRWRPPCSTEIPALSRGGQLGLKGI